MEILDSRGNPTIEVDVITTDGKFSAAVPSGASTGVHEDLELRDGGSRYLGKGVLNAVKNVEKKIAPKLIGVEVFRQREIDDFMIKLDGTTNKSKLGANATLGISLACARAGADYYNLTLPEYINNLLSRDNELLMPRPFFNVINGGKHAEGFLRFQEFMISPRADKFSEALRMGSEIYHHLKKVIEKKYGKNAANVGDEGGFVPPVKKAEEALELLKTAIAKAGHTGYVDIAMDAAASEFFVKRGRGGYYKLPRKKSADQLIDYYLQLVGKYPIVSIEDPFQQEDFKSFAKLRKRLSEDFADKEVQVVGDDLTVTNVNRIEIAIKEDSCNCLLMKVNQIGTLSEALDAVRMAYDNKWQVMVSHRSGETTDPFIADLAVGIGCGQIKAGAPCRGERTAKYNQLLRIERFMSER